MLIGVVLGTNDLDRSKRFYDAITGALGCPPPEQNIRASLVRYRHRGSELAITTPLNGLPATVANGGVVGFQMESPDQADAWYQAGISAGGEGVEDPPGVRIYPNEKIYTAYLRDPDGHKLVAVYTYTS